MIVNTDIDIDSCMHELELTDLAGVKGVTISTLH